MSALLWAVFWEDSLKRGIFHLKILLKEHIKKKNHTSIMSPNDLNIRDISSKKNNTTELCINSKYSDQNLLTGLSSGL